MYLLQILYLFHFQMSWSGFLILLSSSLSAGWYFSVLIVEQHQWVHINGCLAFFICECFALPLTTLSKNNTQAFVDFFLYWLDVFHGVLEAIIMICWIYPLSLHAVRLEHTCKLNSSPLAALTDVPI